MIRNALRLIFFFLLLPAGSFLECETCSATSDNCTGSPETCDLSQDACAVSVTVVSQRRKIQPTIEKGCYFSNNCIAGWIQVTFGPGEFVQEGIRCCLGDNCAPSLPQAPQVNATANGKRCPACYSVSKTCPTAMVNCTGSEDYCLDLVMYQYGGKAVYLKGCTTKFSCDELQTSNMTFLEASLNGKTITCTLASQSSSLSGSFLLCLLMMKIFS